jgi:hypothetical protein
MTPRREDIIGVVRPTESDLVRTILNITSLIYSSTFDFKFAFGLGDEMDR